jgi:hypothetical protein
MASCKNCIDLVILFYQDELIESKAVDQHGEMRAK